jgi:hypothetical protein
VADQTDIIAVIDPWIVVCKAEEISAIVLFIMRNRVIMAVQALAASYFLIREFNRVKEIVKPFRTVCSCPKICRRVA